jgi:hypothetical protein
MRVVYLIQTHTNPEQIYRLVKVIKKSSNDSYIVMSHNFNASQIDVELFESLPNVKVLRAKKVGRGDFSITQAYLDVVDWILTQNIQFDWLANLTGQDYPTQSLSKFENFLAATEYDGFFDYFNVLSDKCTWGAKDGRDRYFYQYWWSGIELAKWQRGLFKPFRVLINNVQPFVRIDSSYGLIIGQRAASAPFNEKFVCYGGSYFKTISRQCIQYIHDFCSTNPDFVNYYKKVRLPDESFMQTILVNSGLFNFYPRNMRYIDWENSRHGHPRILTSEDFPNLIKDKYYFARKFDMNRDGKVLDMLDERIFQAT